MTSCVAANASIWFFQTSPSQSRPGMSISAGLVDVASIAFFMADRAASAGGSGDYGFVVTQQQDRCSADERTERHDRGHER